MKSPVTVILALVICFILGFGAGWFSFRSKLQAILEQSGITEDRWIETYKAMPTTMENLETDDRMTTLVSLAALERLEEDKIEETKHYLAWYPACYFVIYGPPDKPRKGITEERMSILGEIEKVKTKSPILEAAIEKAIANKKLE